MNVALRPLREDEFASYLEAGIEQYATDMVENGGFLPEAARQKAETDFTGLFPEGLGTPGVFLFAVELDASRVGHVLFAERELHERRQAWIYEVWIDPDLRGRGLGRRAMELVEREVRARGLERVELNVFGGNAVARSLYRSLGYAERAVIMSKELT